MNLFVIVVTFNGEKWIRQCLDSVVRSSIEAKIIVIDNCSSDNTIHVIKEEYQQVLLVESVENLGFGKANNLGLKSALHNKADFVFLLNQDAWLGPNTLEDLINVWKENINYGIISPVHLHPDGSRLDDNFSLYLSPNNCPNFISDLYLNSLKPLYEIKFVNAAGWLVSRDCLHKVGGFDPLFFHYGEDDDYCRRVLLHQLKIGLYTKSVLYHARDHYQQKITNRWQKIRKIHKRAYIPILLRVKNPLCSFKRQLIFEIIDISSNLIKYLLMRNLNGFLVQIYLLYTLFKEVRKTRNSRKITIQEGTTFL